MGMVTKTMGEEEEAQDDTEWRQKHDRYELESVVNSLQTLSQNTSKRMEVFPAGMTGKPFGFLPPDFKNLDVKTENDLTSHVKDDTSRPSKPASPCSPAALLKTVSVKISSSEQKLHLKQKQTCDNNNSSPQSCLPNFNEIKKMVD